MKKISILIILLKAFALQAQINNTLLENPIELSDSMQESLCLSVYENTFLKNNEYFDDIAQGYTLFGTQLQTSLAYVVNPNVRIQAGIYVRKDFGNDKFTKVAPLVSIKLQKNGYSAIMGNLEGNIAHKLIEPMYDYERFILHPLENGLQMIVNRNKFWSDTWLNWEVQEYLYSNFQEQLSGGHSSKTVLYSNQKGMLFQLPLQFLISHKGGQIDIDTSSLQTIANMASGIIFEYKPYGMDPFIQTIRSENYVTLFKDLSPSKKMNFKEGSGYYFNATAQTRFHILASAGYWSGKNYLSSRGNYLFQSEASVYGKRGYTEPKRDLLFFRLLYQHKVFDALNVDIRFEPYLDLNKNYFAYSYSVYFTYKKDFNLLNLMNGKKSTNYEE